MSLAYSQSPKATAAECKAAVVRTACHAGLQLTRDLLADTIVPGQRRHVDYIRVGDDRPGAGEAFPTTPFRGSVPASTGTPIHME